MEQCSGRAPDVAHVDGLLQADLMPARALVDAKQKRVGWALCLVLGHNEQPAMVPIPAAHSQPPT